MENFNWDNVNNALKFVQKVFHSNSSKNEKKRAVEALEYAAKQNVAIAQHQLYAMKYSGIIDKPDENAALFWCKKAA